MDPTESDAPMTGVDIDDHLLPLTASQRGMWFAENLSPDYSVTIAQFLEIRDETRPLDHDLFRSCVLVAGHELQSPFIRLVEVDGVPYQVVDDSVPFRVEDLDLRHVEDPVAAAHRWMEHDHQAPVDLLDTPLAVSTLIRVADDRTFWYLRGHHIIIDGYAALTAVTEVCNRYNAALRGEPYTPRPAADLAEIVADDQAYATSTRRAADREHWVQVTRDLPERVTLAQHANTARLNPVNVVASTCMSEAMQTRIDQLATELTTSPAVVLTAAFSAYLARMTGTDDVVLSLPVTGRASARIKRAGGMLSNMLPIRSREVARLSLGDLIDQLRVELTGALRHQRYRFEDIRLDADMRDSTTASFGPIVNMVFFDKPIVIDGAAVDYHILTSGILEDLRLNLYRAGPDADIIVDLHGNSNLYRDDELAAHLKRFMLFTERLVSDTELRVGDTDLLFHGEADDLVTTGEGPSVDIEPGDVLDGFLAQVAQSPDSIAVESGASRWTYAEFDAARRTLAQMLHDDGVRVRSRVLVALDRGFDQVCGVYAALTLGAAYIPVDPEQPAERLRVISEIVEPALVIDAEYLRDKGFEGQFAIGADPAAAPHPPRPALRDTDVAYVIFTSGSTGSPKGVRVGHQAVVNRLDWMQRDHPLSGDDAVLYKTPITFDVSVWELLWPLRTGARMVIAAPAGHRDPEYLRECMERSGVTVAHFVPSMLDVYLDVVTTGGHPRLFPSSMRRVFTSGEALSRSLADTLLESSTVDLVNLYGPTEAAVDVTEHQVVYGEAPDVPIGRPVANTAVHVLDDRLRPVPVGVAGELYLAGVQLAEGYAGRPDLTADRFVANPYATDPGARMYRTGDLVRWGNGRGSGVCELEYLGRTDFQIKIRGQRVELGEIEAVLCSARGVSGAIAVARKLAGGDAVVAYVRLAGGEAEPDAALGPDELLAWCRRRLPSHMVPAAVVTLDSFPVNASGKLDRSALPVPDTEPDTPFVPAESAVENTLATLLSELLGRERIGMRDNLFSLGADSLTAARLVSRARADHGLNLLLTDVFESDDIADLARRAGTDDQTPLPALVRVADGDRPAVMPLSAAQTRLWFVNRMDPHAATYNMPGAVRFDEPVDVGALQAAIVDVVDRHETLRTRFPSVNGEPAQEVLSPDEVRSVITLEARDAHGSLDDAIRAEAAAGFDLINEIGFRCRLLLHPTGHVLVLVLHHMVADGASLRPLIRDLLAAYAARCADRRPEFAPLPVRYTDYTMWQQRLLGTPENPTDLLNDELGFWRHELTEAPELLALPTDRPRPRVADGHGSQVDLTLGAAEVDGISQLAQQLSITPFSVVHSALALVLSRRSATDDIVIGTAVAGRDHHELDDLVGMFVNTVVLRTRVQPSSTVGQLLVRSHRARTRAMAHSTIPFERVVDAVAPHRSLSYTPIFQVGLTMQTDQTAMVDAATGLELIDARVPAAKYDLAVTVTQRAGADVTYDIEIAYATQLFDHSTVAAIGAELRRVLRDMVASPDAPIARIDMLDSSCVAELTRPAVSPVAPATLPELLQAGAQHARPSSYAVSGAVNMTWDVFSARTNQLARELIRRGIGPGQIVAISIPRSAQSVLATVSVAKTGAAFVSIDPRYPDDRRAAMLDDSGAVFGLTVEELTSSVPTRDERVDWLTVDAVSVELDVAGHSGEAIDPGELTRPIAIDDVAYLIYTSGSTGRPKAASLSHRGLANLLVNQRKTLLINDKSRVLHVASPSFDASIFELTMALGAGAQLVVSPADVYAGSDLERVIDTQGVTHAVMTPSALATVDPSAVPTLRTVISVGESCHADLVNHWAGAGREFFNLYGPTEATIWATAAGPMSAADEVTIGRPIDGVGALVLDHGLRPVPDGVIGEIYLTGVQIGQGYHGRPDLTARHFVADPFRPGQRMYRTGDRASRSDSGELTYHGRNDFQLKVRGLRIEPGEVDGVLTTHPAVSGALSLGVAGPAGETVLVSYVTPATGHDPLPQQLIDYAASRLPGHLVPHTVIVVDAFSLTPAGKVDRSALPPVEFTMSGDFVPPRSQFEALVADIFVSVLGIERVSVTDGFFELGGNSLSAARVTTRLSAALDRQVSVKEIFEAPTAAQLAARLTTSMSGHAIPPLVARSRAEMVPVSTVQRGMWLLNRADPDSAAYNVALALKMNGRLDVDALQAAIADLIGRHESLRTSYPMVNGEPIQVIIPAEVMTRDLHVDVVDVTGSLDGAIAEVTGRGFDITVSAPTRLAVLRSSPVEHVLVFVVHHISADGASMAPLARDLMAAYAARLDGERPRWQPLPVQYADFTLWQGDKLALMDEDGRTEEQRQLDYWNDRLAGVPDVLEIAADRPRPSVPSFDGDVIDFEIPADLARSLETVARVHNTTLFMVTHAAFAVLLARISNRDDLVIGTPFAGRADPVLEDVAGMFVNTLALRTRVAPDEEFGTLLERVRSEDLADMAHTDVSFESIVSRVLDAPPTSHNPLFQVMFAFQNIDFPTLDFAGLRVTPIDEQLSSAKVDLQLTLFPDDPTGTTGLGEGAIKGQFVYATDLFEAETVTMIAARYARVLEAVATDATCIVGDIVIHTAEELVAEDLGPGAASLDTETMPLSALVALAAEMGGGNEAISADGVVTTFAGLADLCSALSTALPDSDADTVLTMALMSGVPGLAAAGPDALQDGLVALRANAVRVTGAPANGRMPAEGIDRR